MQPQYFIGLNFVLFRFLNNALEAYVLFIMSVSQQDCVTEHKDQIKLEHRDNMWKFFKPKVTVKSKHTECSLF